MKRCSRIRARLTLGACMALAGPMLTLPPPVAAQTMQREAPKDVKRGLLTVTAPPLITLDGQPDRLSPGARIRNTDNLLLMSGSIVGQSLAVLYRRDVTGLVHEVWVLTPEEDAKLAGADGAQRFADLLNLIFGTRP